MSSVILFYIFTFAFNFFSLLFSRSDEHHDDDVFHLQKKK
jgi:hypothetical protein